MIEIKFRGLMTTGEWVYGLPHLDLPKSTLYFNECSYRICWNPESGGQSNAPIKNGTLGQFTGLTDKNGVEIYEGDICRAEFRGLDGITVIQGHIIMDEFMWCIDCTGFIGDDIFSINRPHNFEVIGNIHENPELLNK